MKKIKYKDIKEILEKNSLEVKSEVSANEIFLSLKTILNSSGEDLSFFSNIKYLNDLKKIKAKACLIEEKYIKYLPSNCNPIIVEDPYLALAFVNNLFNPETFISNGIISSYSSIDSNSKIEKNIQINPFTMVSYNTEIKEGSYIGSNSNIGPNVIINKNVVIHDNVSISNAIIMENSIIKSGARIGGTGFGFEIKTKQKIKHSGNVLIGKNSSIGSNTTIDRAVFDSTSIGEF